MEVISSRLTPPPATGHKTVEETEMADGLVWKKMSEAPQCTFSLKSLDNYNVMNETIVNSHNYPYSAVLTKAHHKRELTVQINIQECQSRKFRLIIIIITIIIK